MTPQNFSQLSAEEQAAVWREQQARIAALEAQVQTNVDAWQPHSADFFLRQMLETLPTLLYATDTDGVILFSRGSGLRFFDIADDEDAGESLLERYADSEPLVYVQRALQGTPTENVRVEHDGIAYEATYQPLYDADDTLIGMMCLVNYIDPLDRAERALHASERRLRAIFDASNHFMGMVNTDGVIVEINDPALQLTNASREEYVGQTIWEAPSVFGTDNAALVRDLFRDALRDNAVRTELSINTGDDEATAVDLTMQPLHNDEGAVSMILIEASDITERKRAQRAIERAFRRERNVSDLKSRFITTTSHEFRTPLAVISSSSFLLQRHYERLSPEKREKHFAKIQTNVDNIAAMLDDILLLGQLQSNTWEMRWDLVDVAFVVRDCTAHFAEMYERHTVQITTEPESIIVDGDSRLLRQAVMNILRNAFIYTPDGGTIDIDVHTDKGKLIFTVADNGIGIRERDMPRIYDVFFRGTNIDEIAGRGLGLSIVRDIAHLHKGHIGVKSTAGDGTTVRLTLPYTATS